MYKLPTVWTTHISIWSDNTHTYSTNYKQMQNVWVGGVSMIICIEGIFSDNKVFTPTYTRRELQGRDTASKQFPAKQNN